MSIAPNNLKRIKTQGELLDSIDCYRRNRKEKEFVSINQVRFYSNGDDNKHDRLSKVINAVSQLIRQGDQGIANKAIDQINEKEIVFVPQQKIESKEKELKGKGSWGNRRKAILAARELLAMGSITPDQYQSIINQAKELK